MKKVGLISVMFLLLVIPCRAGTFDQSHGAWTTLLQKHVSRINGGSASQVDYEGFKTDREMLQRYLASLSAVRRDQFDRWDRNTQLAFLINAYNAFTVELILTAYPDLESIRDLGSLFSSPWKKTFFVLLGKTRNLDWIEQDMIRGSGRYNEPLIHFAVNCASIGCPALRNEAYVADSLDAQLNDAARSFLSDRSRNYFEASENRLYVSKIFDWYEEDFSKGWRGYHTLKEFFAANADTLADSEGERDRIRKGEYDIRFLDYDWRLNQR